MTALLEQSALAIPLPVPKVKLLEIEMLCGLLEAGGDWMTASDISFAYEEFNERRVRAIAAAAGERMLSYPGSPGYKLFKHATIEEINHAIEATERQAHEMMKRSIAWRRAYHQRRVS